MQEEANKNIKWDDYVGEEIIVEKFMHRSDGNLFMRSRILTSSDDLKKIENLGVIYVKRTSWSMRASLVFDILHACGLIPENVDNVICVTSNVEISDFPFSDSAKWIYCFLGNKNTTNDSQNNIHALYSSDDFGQIDRAMIAPATLDKLRNNYIYTGKHQEKMLDSLAKLMITKECFFIAWLVANMTGEYDTHFHYGWRAKDIADSVSKICGVDFVSPEELMDVEDSFIRNDYQVVLNAELLSQKRPNEYKKAKKLASATKVIMAYREMLSFDTYLKIALLKLDKEKERSSSENALELFVSELNKLGMKESVSACLESGIAAEDVLRGQDYELDTGSTRFAQEFSTFIQFE